MLYPILNSFNTKTQIQSTFSGLDCRESCARPFFADMQNLTGKKYPLLCVRDKRAELVSISADSKERQNVFFTENGKITAVSEVNDGFVCCDEAGVFVQGKKIEDCSLESIDTPRTVVGFGKNFYIAPDGKYVCEKDGVFSVTSPEGVFGEGASFFTAALCNEKGTLISPNYYCEEEPSSPTEAQSWINKAESPLCMYRYDAQNKKWIFECDIFVQIFADAITLDFQKNDRAIISGFEDEALNGEKTVLAVKSNAILINAVPEDIFLKQTSGVSIKKIYPKLDFAVESANRIWGCRYGEGANGEFVNEIYASALGDPLRWYDFDGISTDSYCVSLGAPGEFTGAAVLSGEVYFFKENCIFRISGTDPSNFTLNTITAPGVEKGSHKSIVNLNEKLIYKSQSGIMIFDGSFPYSVSENLSDTHYKNAIAGGFDSKYVVAMQTDAGEQNLFVFDMNKGMWFKEYSLFVEYIINRKNCLYLICESDTQNTNSSGYYVYLFNSSGIEKACPLFIGEKDESKSFLFIPEDDDIEWFAQTGFSNKENGSVFVRSLVFRLYLESGAYFKAEIKCHDDCEWKELCCIQSNKTQSYCLPVNTPKCDFYSLRFSGKGSCVLYSLSEKCEMASEVNVIGR